VEYVQGGKADESKPMPEVMNWKYDPVRGGPSRVMGDIGTHAHNLARFITGLEVDEVSAEIGAIVPGRLIDDYGGALLRFENGARGSFWVTQAAAGVENGLRIRVSGSKGSLEWLQEIPQALTFKPLHGPSENRTPNGPGTQPLSARSTRLVAGHPEGFPDAFANLYSDAAEAISARRAGKQPDPLALYFPNAWDGLQGIRFVNSVIASSNANGQWTKC
jgi:predicted dehydrogenase